MKRSIIMAVMLGLLASPAPADDSQFDAIDQWPQFRGPLGTGVAPNGDPPVTWSEDRNVRWKTAIPGRGHSSPVVWGDRIFLTTAIPVGDALPPDHRHAP
ncbi:MAG: PQQ-binding-like beta-propeller repeat protein, partial [Planctomycetes bacterium]|nr:PQQ-binding-like beta-propeller repeat protein [Planctomycetota bacterium]